MKAKKDERKNTYCKTIAISKEDKVFIQKERIKLQMGTEAATLEHIINQYRKQK